MTILPGLVLTVCMLQNPGTCKDVNIPLMLSNPNELQLPYKCARAGQLEAQKFMSENPSWRVTRWKCPKPQDNKQDI